MVRGSTPTGGQPGSCRQAGARLRSGGPHGPPHGRAQEVVEGELGGPSSLRKRSLLRLCREVRSALTPGGNPAWAHGPLWEGPGCVWTDPEMERTPWLPTPLPHLPCFPSLFPGSGLAVPQGVRHGALQPSPCTLLPQTEVGRSVETGLQTKGLDKGCILPSPSVPISAPSHQTTFLPPSSCPAWPLRTLCLWFPIPPSSRIPSPGHVLVHVP